MGQCLGSCLGSQSERRGDPLLNAQARERAADAAARRQEAYGKTAHGKAAKKSAAAAAAKPSMGGRE